MSRTSCVAIRFRNSDAVTMRAQALECAQKTFSSRIPCRPSTSQSLDTETSATFSTALVPTPPKTIHLQRVPIFKRDDTTLIYKYLAPVSSGVEHFAHGRADLIVPKVEAFQMQVPQAFYKGDHACVGNKMNTHMSDVTCISLHIFASGLQANNGNNMWM